MNQIAKIHIAKKQLGLDDDTYRAALKVATGKTSCKGMSSAELDRVLAHFKAKGFKVRSKAKRAFSNKSYVRLIYALWASCHKLGEIQDGSKSALRSFVAKRTEQAGHRRDDPEFLTYDEASPIIETLKSMEKRGKVKRK
jgi:phage gp16-like protein